MRWLLDVALGDSQCCHCHHTHQYLLRDLGSLPLQVWSPSMPRGYNLQSFRNDLKGLMLKAGVEAQPVCLFLEDHQLVDPGFLECVNSLLSGGEVWCILANVVPCLISLHD